MARPYDLLAFLNQDTRWDSINDLYHDLYERQQTIDKLWTDLEGGTDILTILSSDENCVKSGQLTSIDWYMSFLEDGKSKGIPDEEFQLKSLYDGFTDVPDCKKISSLTFSMFAFEHLEVWNHFTIIFPPYRSNWFLLITPILLIHLFLN